MSPLRFKQSRISLLIPNIHVLSCFVNFFGEFFSEMIRKIYGNRKILKISCCFKIRI